MPQLLKHRYNWLILLGLVNLLYFSLLDPGANKSVVLFGGFLLLAADLYLLLRVVLFVLERLTGRQITLRRRMALLGTVVVIILLALQSIGQLSVRDALAVLGVGIIFVFYSSYFRFGRRS